MSDLSAYLVAAIAVRLGMATVDAARQVLESGDPGESVWVERGLLTPHQQVWIDGLAAKEQNAGERDPTRLGELLSPFRELMERRGVTFPGAPVPTALPVGGPVALAESVTVAVAEPPPRPAAVLPSPLETAVAALADGEARRQELARRCDSWLELARSPEPNLPSWRERTRHALERVEELRRAALAGVALAEEQLLSTLRRAPANEEAHRRLAQAYDLWTRLTTIDDREAGAQHFRRHAEHHRLALGEPGGGEARLRVESEPANAAVWLSVAGPRGWSWGSPLPPSVRPPERPADGVGPGTFLGVTPLPALELAPGRYHALVRCEGAEVQLPVRVDAGRETSLRVTLRSRVEVREGFVLVPGGPFISGNPYGSVTTETATFAVGVFPVTFGEFCEFLDARAADPQEVERLLPRTPRGEPLCVHDEEGRYRPFLSGRGPIPRSVPAVGVSWGGAGAYADWRSDRDATGYRLPTLLEWEKAARGTDGSAYPWGDRFDPWFCLTNRSAGATEGPQPVGRFPYDASPYGARDMGGNVLQWCADGPADEPGLRWACGGAWNRDQVSALAFGRSRLPLDYREEGVGFRLLHSPARETR